MEHCLNGGALAMQHPIWAILAWAVACFAVGMKLRRLSHLLFQKTLNRAFATEDFRASLERIWEKEIVR